MHINFAGRLVKMGHNLTKMVFAGPIMMVIPTIALAQAVLSDQKDAIAHMANSALAAERCEMTVNQEILDTTMEHAGLVMGDIEEEPYKSALATATQEAQISLDTFGRQTVCERLDGMYGPTGLRIPGLIAG